MEKDSQNIEYKTSWRDEYIKWICGFANALGGRIYIGKDDRGRVCGISGAKRLMEDIPNKVRDVLGIMAEVNLHREKDLEYLEIIVEPYPWPISYKGQYHYRSGSTKQVLKGASLDRFLLNKQGRKWDGVPVPGVGTDALAPAALSLFRSKASLSGRVTDSSLGGDTRVLIKNLRLFDGDYLKRAAVLIFCADPERYVSGAFIKIGFFRHESELVFQDEIHGGLIEQADKAMDLIRSKYLKAYIRYENLNRVEQFLFPLGALREALLNAIVHKDYNSGIPIQIKVYEDKIIFWNDGYLPENWTVEHLKRQHPSSPYNPDIANVFFRAGLIESWGRGIEKMTSECRKRGIEGPDIQYLPSNFMLEINAGDILAQMNRAGTDGPDVGLGEKLGEKLGENRKKILNAMKANPSISIRALSQSTGFSTTAIEKNIRYLKENGYIRRIGPAKGGYWMVVENHKENE